MESIIEILVLLLISAIKFIFAAGYLLVEREHPYSEVFLILLSGGIIGTFVFYYFSEWTHKLLNRFFKIKKKSKIFTRQNRKLVQFKSKYGIIGIALLTPVFFSIPIGCFIAAKFYKNKKNTLPVLLLSVLFWSAVLPLIKLCWQP